MGQVGLKIGVLPLIPLTNPSQHLAPQDVYELLTRMAEGEQLEQFKVSLSDEGLVFELDKKGGDREHD